ncbi:hypothetical protein YC2023_015079 [Brassica napus]
MTNNFQRVVGEGGFGVVFHGTLNGSEQVAVKVLSQSSSQGYKHFKAETNTVVGVVSLISTIVELALMKLLEFLHSSSSTYHPSTYHPSTYHPSTHHPYHALNRREKT